MDLRSAAKKVLSFLISDTLAMALMFVVAGYSIHALLVATTAVGALLNAGIALICLLLARHDMRRRDRNRDAALVIKIAEEGECQADECCQDGHCEIEEESCSTEAKPEKKVC